MAKKALELAEWQKMSAEHHSFLNEIVQLHGSETAFAPRPQQPEAPAPQDAEPAPLEDLSEKSSRECPVHKLCYLVNPTSVWTVVKAGFQDSLSTSYNAYHACKCPVGPRGCRWLLPLSLERVMVPFQDSVFPVVHQKFYFGIPAIGPDAPCGGWSCCSTALSCHNSVPASFPCSCAQVARRPGYKGNVSGITALPVDACTVPGALIMMATVLPTASLAADALQECVTVLETLESHMQVNTTLQLLPADVFAVQVRGNTMSLSSVKAVIHELGLTWARLLGSHTSLPTASSFIWGFVQSYLII